MSFKLRKFVTNLHKRTKRDVLERMVNKKVFCMKVAKQYGKEYWDGNRKFGYGGYKYIKDRWKSVAIKLIKSYNLKILQKFWILVVAKVIYFLK